MWLNDSDFVLFPFLDTRWVVLPILEPLLFISFDIGSEKEKNKRRILREVETGEEKLEEIWRAKILLLAEESFT